MKWVDAGAPRGNPADEPKLPALTEGWQLGEPDYIITLPTVNIPAEGNDIFPTPNLTIDIPEDRWIRALEIRPSNREVTHHSVLFMAGGHRRRHGRPVGIRRRARRVGRRHAADGVSRRRRPLDSQGPAAPHQPALSPERQGADRSRRASASTSASGELKKEVASAVAGDISFKIPAGAKNHEMRALYVIDQDINIVSYFPHMHFRGKDMTLTATLPGGSKQTLLRVPGYDFNWQLYYYPQEPVPLPRGTIVEAVAHYDNSADNPNNPDPTRDVTFGEQSTDEMMFGVFDFTPKDGVSPVPTTVDKRMDVLASTLPADSTYTTSVTILKPIPAVLHLPRTGDGAFYLGQGRFQINVIPIKNITWTGDNFEFRMDARFGPNAAYTFDVKGNVTADGTVHGEVTPVGVAKAPFSRSFDGQVGAELATTMRRDRSLAADLEEAP